MVTVVIPLRYFQSNLDCLLSMFCFCSLNMLLSTNGINIESLKVQCAQSLVCDTRSWFCCYTQILDPLTQSKSLMTLIFILSYFVSSIPEESANSFYSDDQFCPITFVKIETYSIHSHTLLSKKHQCTTSRQVRIYNVTVLIEKIELLAS